MYDRAATFWQMIILVITSLQDMGLFRGRRNRSRILNAQMWGAHMRFFRQMLMASKVSIHCVGLCLSMRPRMYGCSLRIAWYELPAHQTCCFHNAQLL